MQLRLARRIEVLVQVRQLIRVILAVVVLVKLGYVDRVRISQEGPEGAAHGCDLFFTCPLLS